MSVPTTSNVIPMRLERAAPTSTITTVLHAVADDEGLVEIAPVVAAIDRRPSFRQLVAHAGPTPDPELGTKLAGIPHRLNIPAGTHAERTAAALTGFERLLVEEHPDILVVAGDDDVAVAAAMSAAKFGIAVAHLGSGLRCWDWRLPDEINRTVIDRLSDTLFTFSEDAAANLRGEGVPEGRIHAVGNTRVDMLRLYESRARGLAAWKAYGVDEHDYVLISMQQLRNLEPDDRLERIADGLRELAATCPVLWLRHPRTRALTDSDAGCRLLAEAGVRCIGPATYVEALSLQASAGAVVTDAGTVQEEASSLGVRCYTLLSTTPRPITLTHGTNILLGDDPAALASVRPTRLPPTPAAIPRWDGHAGERVAEVLAANYTLALAGTFAGERIT
jgi:UDP-N-acetylglucosamine 2-epimerase (non-hydrolysing)